MNQQTNDYDNEWAQICEAENAYDNKIKADKLRYKQELSKICNVKKIWDGLKNDMSYWEPLGVFDLRIYECKRYGNKQIKAQIKHSEHELFELDHQFEDKSEYGYNHCFIWQRCEFEDSYRGIMAIPLSNYSYFVIRYNC